MFTRNNQYINKSTINAQDGRKPFVYGWLNEHLQWQVGKLNLEMNGVNKKGPTLVDPFYNLI